MAACEHPSLEMVADRAHGRSFVRCTVCKTELLDFQYPSRPQRSYRAGPSRRLWSLPREIPADRALPLPREPIADPQTLNDLCPSCESAPITRNGRCEACQWAVN